VRAAPLFGWIETCTLPPPVPDPGLTDIHGVLVDADHPHPAVAVTATVEVVAAADGATWVGAIANAQLSPCETAKTCPAIVRLPDRAGPLFAAAVNATVPLPLPLAPDVIDSQPALLVAVQAHPLPAVTFTDPFPPPIGALKDDSDSAKVQP